MRVTAGLELDANAGPSAGSVIGEAMASPGALLGILETALGRSGPEVGQAERAALLLPRLEAVEGYWSASFVADGWGTATRLIRDRDALMLEGWRCEPISRRWASLWSVTEGIPGGPGDRWAAVGDSVGRRAIDLRGIGLVDPRPEWIRYLPLPFKANQRNVPFIERAATQDFAVRARALQRR